MAEEIRPYPRMPIYEVSNLGRVRRVGGKWLSLQIRKDRRPQYYAVTLHYNGKKTRIEVQRLVALTFLGEPPTTRHEVAHWDGNGLNNAVTNLRWATRKENCADTKRHGRVPHLFGAASPRCKLSDDDVREIRRRFWGGENRRRIAAAFKTSPMYISHIAYGRRREHVS